MMIIIWVGLAVLIYYLVTGKNITSGHFSNQSNAIDLLNERFAKGEIDETTYLHMKNTLKK